MNKNIFVFSLIEMIKRIQLFYLKAIYQNQWVKKELLSFFYDFSPSILTLMNLICTPFI